MTLSVDYPNFQISPCFKIPKSLRQLLYQTWLHRYEELYEEENNVTTSLESALLKVLSALEVDNDSLSHFRYVYMALILALAVEPTIKAYLPNDTRSEQIFKLVANWWQTGEVPSQEQIKGLFPQKSVGVQAIDEALDVFRNLLLVLSPKIAKIALLEILDECLEGYAIFPGSERRRDLFNWWLLEVVAASWCLQFPHKIYTIKGIQTLNNPPTILLHKS